MAEQTIVEKLKLDIEERERSYQKELAKIKKEDDLLNYIKGMLDITQGSVSNFPYYDGSNKEEAEAEDDFNMMLKYTLKEDKIIASFKSEIKNLYYTKGLIIYDNPNNKSYKPELIAPEPDNFTNISYRWLPLDLDSATSGSHNGDDYLAYTFYVENVGKEIADYWSETVIYDVVKDVDKAVRVRIYRNGDYVTYAKLSSSGNAEPNTVPFEEENLIVRDHVKNFKPGSLDKYTIVIWIEGSDPDCTDELVGGEFKFYMNFNSEYVED